MEYKNQETLNDRWIVEHIFPNVEEKYFVEAGACDGIAASSCYVLETYLGWTGIAIEPNDNYYARLVKNRPHSICENICLAAKDGSVTYLEGNLNTVHPMLGGIKDNLLKYRQNHQEVTSKGREVTKQSLTLESLLCKHNAPKIIDYLAMDIEGSELPVLQIFSFDKYQFLAISLEGMNCNDLLASKGYINVKNPFNSNHHYEQYFVHPDLFAQRNLEISIQHYISLGNNFRKEQQLSAAIDAYQQGSQIEQNNAHLYAYLGVTYKQLGDFTAAAYNLQKAIDLDCQFAPWIYHTIAHNLQLAGNYPEAIAAYYQGIALNQHNPIWVYHSLADLLSQQQRWHEAILAYEQARVLEPNNLLWKSKIKMILDEIRS